MVHKHPSPKCPLKVTVWLTQLYFFVLDTDSMKSPTLDPTSNSSSLFHSSAATNQPSAKPLLGSNLR